MLSLMRELPVRSTTAAAFAVIVTLAFVAGLSFKWVAGLSLADRSEM